jgi:hypothetical protein
LWGQALNDFKQRIKKYDEVYETINDRTMHYIKLIDMWVEGGPLGVVEAAGCRLMRHPYPCTPPFELPPHLHIQPPTCPGQPSVSMCRAQCNPHVRLTFGLAPPPPPPVVTRRVTGRGHMDVNRISGYIPGKIVFFLMQVGWGPGCRVQGL